MFIFNVIIKVIFNVIFPLFSNQRDIVKTIESIDVGDDDIYDDIFVDASSSSTIPSRHSAEALPTLSLPTQPPATMQTPPEKMNAPPQSPLYNVKTHGLHKILNLL